MRAKNIYLGKKGQGEGTLLEDFIGHVWERGFYKNNVVLKNKKNQQSTNKTNQSTNQAGQGPCVTPRMMLQDGDPSRSPVLWKFCPNFMTRRVYVVT